MRATGPSCSPSLQQDSSATGSFVSSTPATATCPSTDDFASDVFVLVEPESMRRRAQPWHGRAPPLRPRARVARVIDGETIEVASGARIRLVQIDTPELGSGECYSRKAASELRRLGPVGAAVRLERDSRLDGVDRCGRLLRYVRSASFAFQGGLAIV